MLRSPVFARPPQFWMHTFNVVGTWGLRAGDADAVTAIAAAVRAAVPAAGINNRLRVLVSVAIAIEGLSLGFILFTS
jgi:hypothetical protein